MSSLRSHHLVSLNYFLVRNFKTFFEATKSSNIKINHSQHSYSFLNFITPFTPRCVEYYINLKQNRHQRSAVFIMFVYFLASHIWQSSAHSSLEITISENQEKVIVVFQISLNYARTRSESTKPKLKCNLRKCILICVIVHIQVCVFTSIW